MGFSVFVVLLETLKTFRLRAHSVDSLPFRDVAYEGDEETRTTNRLDVARSKHIGVQKVENGRSAGGTSLCNRRLVTFSIDAANTDVRRLLVTRQVDSFDHPSLDHSSNAVHVDVREAFVP